MNIIISKKLTKKEKDILLIIRKKMLKSELPCRFCDEQEGNMHNEGIHTINSFLTGHYKLKLK